MSAAVLNTNVLASGFLGYYISASTPGELLRRWRGEVFGLVTSEQILVELGRTFTRPYFSRRLSVTECAENIALLRTRLTLVSITVEIHGIATHPEDDLVLATAMSGHADYLVTGDLKLQRLGTYQGVRILSPRDFPNVLEQE